LLSYSDDLAASTARFLETLRGHFNERLTAPAAPVVSSCERPPLSRPEAQAELRERFVFRDFTWEGRPATDYKADASLPFDGVSRHELIGPAGEQAAFDLRYFEVAPGGYTSLERHLHIHAIIAIRGEGVLVSNGRRHPLRRFDIAYVPPLQPHQLRNESGEPFGFFCIVDRQRDRPQSVGNEG